MMTDITFPEILSPTFKSWARVNEERSIIRTRREIRFFIEGFQVVVRGKCKIKIHHQKNLTSLHC